MIVSVGTVQNVLLCMPVTSDQSSALDQQICPPSGSQYFHIQTQQGYVIDPASAGYLDGLAVPFDYTAASGFFALAFTMVVGVWMVSASVGGILALIKRG
ncbi:hypothetical protein [Burkholderia stabilis]|uniref:hypothetical protein n=1 Tax=Burkholderia stabilis TaxID=95485 RepID=UPI000AD293EE|nr:hypothetical protein [Burkholderia stabilis]HDR9495537.1 hypothetical protein [Burkholderia stabilis]HDR9526650.1 hypothetical protein [Burkholderia stabilis]HDR9534132.1 hypothetical protein [Burkholderia stabilis]HDR9540662.1 hypothetical protein [Burkholderia stabilis]HDR9549283.1 hypothetical protein [Burkholderia stabilis]